MTDILKKITEIVSNMLAPNKDTEESLLKEVKKKQSGINFDAEFIEYLSVCIKSDSFEYPALPDIISKITKLTKDKNAEFKLFADIIKNDPVITLKLLQLANSVYYKRNYEITGIEQAISRIGISGVQSLVISITLKNKIFNNEISLSLSNKLWKKSLLTAIICAKTAVLLGELESSLYTLGLLHNIGGFISLSIGNKFVKQHKEYIVENNFLEKSVSVFERKMTRLILLKWHFPTIQVQAIDFIDVMKADEDLKEHKILYFAFQLAKGLLSGQLSDFEKIEKLYFYSQINEYSKLNLEESDLIKIISESLKEYQSIIEISN